MDSFSKCDSFRDVVSNTGYGRPPLEAHLWWARELHSVFRALTISTLAVPTEDLMKLLARPVEFPDKVVFDPFMGSGTEVVEAARLGCHVIGIDLNPVAWWIVRNRLASVSLDQLDQAFERLEATVGPAIRNHYQSPCPQCGNPTNAVFYLWAWITSCEQCGKTMKLFTHSILLERGNAAVVVCPRCGEVFEIRKHEVVECINCQLEFAPHRGNFQRGRFRCLRCGHSERLTDAVKRIGGPLDRAMICVCVDCPEHHRLYKKPDTVDIEQYRSITEEFHRAEPQMLYPRDPLPPEPQSLLSRVGYTHFKDLFTPRQLLSLSKLLQAIADIEDKVIRDSFLTLFSGSLIYNSVLCGYSRHRGVQSMFARATLVAPVLAAESNIWGTDSKLSFPGRYASVLREAKRTYADRTTRAPQTVLGEEQFPKVRLVNSFAELRSRAVWLLCQDSTTSIPIPGQSVDAVITNPPFYDNVDYSTLSDFFYVWLHLPLQREHQCFAPPYASRSAETVTAHRPNASQETFDIGLTQAFRECHRVLKPHAPLVFTFYAKNLPVMASCLEWILNAGFYVSEICTWQRESFSHRVVKGQSTLAVKAVFFCYKHGAGAPITWEQLQEQFYTQAGAALDSIPGPRPVSRARMIEVGLSEFVKLYSRHYPNVYADGVPVGVEQALRWMLRAIELLPASIGGVGYAGLFRTLARIRRIQKQAFLDLAQVSGGSDKEELLIQRAGDQISEQLIALVPDNVLATTKNKLRSKLGNTWNSLEDESQIFLATAEFLLEQNHNVKGFDFAPLAVEYSKVLETELKQKLCAHLAHYLDAKNHTTPLRAGRYPVTTASLKDHKKLVLGNIEYLLKDAQKGVPANRVVVDFLRSKCPDQGKYALHQLPRLIKRIKDEYRNRAAHTELVELSEIEELRSEVLGSGHLEQLVTL